MYCIFSFHSQEYAIPTDNLLEIIPFQRLTPLPQSVPRLVGLHPYRGSVITIVTLKNQDFTQIENSRYILVMEHSSGQMGILAHQVYAVQNAEIHSSATTNAQYLGQISYNDKLIDVLDPSLTLQIEVK